MVCTYRVVFSALLIHLMLAGHTNIVGDEHEKAFDAMRQAMLEFEVTETYSSPLASLNARHIELHAGRNYDRWSIQELSRMEDGRVVMRNGISRAANEGTVFVNQVISPEGNRLGVLFYSPRIDGNLEFGTRVWPAGGRISLLPFGELAGVEIFGGLVNSSAKTHASSSGALVVECESMHGFAILRLDPESAFLPTQIELTQTPNHVHRGRKVDSIEMAQGGVWPAGGLSNIKWIVDEVKIGHSNGHAYIQAWRLRTEYTSESGIVVTSTHKASVSNVRIGKELSDRELLFDAKIAEGTKVSLVNAQHLSYVWGETWPIPEASGLEEWDGKQRGISMRYLVSGIVFAVAMLAAFAVVCWKRRER